MQLFLMRPTTENYEINHERKFWFHEIPRRKKFGLHEMLTRKNVGPTKYPREKIWNPRNTYEKIFRTRKIPTWKNFQPMKYPWRHDGTVAQDPRDPRWHETHDGTRPTNFSTLTLKSEDFTKTQKSRYVKNETSFFLQIKKFINYTLRATLLQKIVL